jgi:hypothetical protein
MASALRAKSEEAGSMLEWSGMASALAGAPLSRRRDAAS